jgi:hypothetical protein
LDISHSSGSAYFEQKIAKSCGNFPIKGKNRVCLEIWYEPMLAASFPLRPSVKMAWEDLGAPGGRALPEFSYTIP